jgi:ankyrin repeat protein
MQTRINMITNNDQYHRLRKQFLPDHIPKDVSEYAESFMKPVQKYTAYVKPIMEADIDLLSEEDQREFARKAIEMEDFDILKHVPEDMLAYESGKLNNLRMLKFFLKTLPNKISKREAFLGACEGDAVNVVHYLFPLISTDNYALHRGAYLAGKAGSHHVISFLVERFNDKPVLDDIMAGSARGMHMNIVKLMLDSGATDLDNAMSSAADGGHIDIVKLMLGLGATHFDETMSSAAEGGHIDIVKLMLDSGATDFDETMSTAAEGGHIDIVNLMLGLGATNFNRAMLLAAHGGHTSIVKLMLDAGATNFNQAMLISVEGGGHMDIVKLMIDAGATKFDEMMMDAAHEGHTDIVKLMLNLGATDFNEAMLSAVYGEHIDIVELMLDAGATNFNKAILVATDEPDCVDDDIVNLLIDRRQKQRDKVIEMLTNNKQ